jgi:signal transduction histidine kinase/DNA-binding NarL/FixJ family response regulator
MPELATSHDEIDRRRAERARRLARVEIPALRVIGTAFLSLGIFLHNRYLLGDPSLEVWTWLTLGLLAYAGITWGTVRVLYDRGVDPTLLFLVTDVAAWTLAVYFTGAEKSWLFFILLMRIADQTQTNFRRCLGFTLFATFCYGAMLTWVATVDGRPVPMAVAVTRLIFIAVGGLYISLAARTAERRRAQVAEAVRMWREARARAEEASAAKSEFLANMSHEMRTPLHGVIGMLQLAIEDESSPQRLRQLEMARRSAESLLGTIDDLLDFSRIEARKIQLEPIYFPLRDTLNETMKPLGVTAAGKDLYLALGITPDVPDVVWGDPVRLRQVLINLVANAIKFTHEGEIAIRVSMRENRIRFEVRDTGIGIPEADRQRVFEPFAQVDSSSSRRFAGTGLGLAIVATLVEAMGGKISLETAEGKGSIFWFELPLPADGFAAARPRAPWESALAGARFLVVDRREISREFVAEMLRSRGASVVVCDSAATVPAGRFACAITSDETVMVDPSVVITSPLEHIRDDRVRVTWPVAEGELMDAIGAAMKLARRPPVMASLEPLPHAGTLRVLVAEDNLVAQEFAAEALRRLGHSVVLASDGEEALGRLRREIFDLVLMDVQMPALDGLEVTRRYRSGESEGVRTPIIALTAHYGREDRERCIEAGMDGVLTKPIDLRQLESVVRSVTGVEPIVDAVGGNLKLLARVSDAFARQTPMLLAQMRAAIERRDAEALHKSAHTVKGAVSNFDGDPSLDLALMLEAAARAGDFARAANLVARLETALAALERRITAAMAET